MLFLKSGLKSSVYVSITQLPAINKVQTEQVLANPDNYTPNQGYVIWKEKIATA
jgi:hypothetical protein